MLWIVVWSLIWLGTLMVIFMTKSLVDLSYKKGRNDGFEEGFEEGFEDGFRVCKNVYQVEDGKR